MSTKFKTIVSFLIAFAFTFIFYWALTLFFIPVISKYKCYMMGCPPASWKEILDVAQINGNSHIEWIEIRPSGKTTYTQSGPVDITISISYIPLESKPDDFTQGYPIRRVEFDDRILNPRFENETGMSTSGLSPETKQESLRRVKVHPREVFELTWELVEKEAKIPADKAISVSGMLHFVAPPNNYEQCNCESMWSISYIYDKFGIEYIINAQTAEITQVKRIEIKK